MDDYDGVVDTLYPVMDKARTEGKIRFIGFSEQYKTDPQGLTALINRFLTPMTNMIMDKPPQTYNLMKQMLAV